ncbi:MAG: L,D-transpeptidase family protein [Caulobacterales bacterium]|nr:L,D-transpeptidase family protein [Caulobacterales bacterium]
MSPQRLTALSAVLGMLILTGGCDRVASGFGDGPPAVSSAALKSATDDAAVRKFYEARQWRAAWSKRDASALLDALKDAPRHGLDGSRFTSLIREASSPAERDAELTLAALNYADALARGAVDPRKLFKVYAIKRPSVDVVAGLAEALKGHDVEGWIKGLAPQDDEYRALSDAYLAYRDLAADPITGGPPLQPGDGGARVDAVAAWLQGAGYLPADAKVKNATFDAPLVAALRVMQKAAKLPVTGQPDEATLKVMNDGVAMRAKQLAVNLERRRWLPRDVPDTRIDVNIATAELVYLHDGASAWTSRVVAGAPDPDRETPMLIGAFDQLVVNPPWVVPKGIAEKEILPKGEAYMAAERMTVVDGKVVQQPGPDSSLGLVKFDMQNPHAIYLHDTPAKALFASAERHRSHGCARVERAVEFARFLANERGRAEAFDKALATGETGTVALGEKIPVRLLYTTAYRDPAGLWVFTADPYGWDDQVSGALGLGALSAPHAADQPVASLLGP